MIAIFQMSPILQANQLLLTMIELILIWSGKNPKAMVVHL